MYGKIKEHLSKALSDLKEAGLYKEERIIESPQGAAIQVKGKEVLNFCANNYLGLAPLSVATHHFSQKCGYMPPYTVLHSSSLQAFHM